MTRTLHPELWWYLARATGITAWVASLGSLLAGLALATRALGSRPRGPWLLDLHRGLAGVTVAFTALHVTALVADSYLHFGAAEVLVPFTSGWRPLAVGAGVLVMWLLLATAHALTAGTDAGHPVVVATAVGAVAAATFLLAYRAVGPGRATGRAARPAGA